MNVPLAWWFKLYLYLEIRYAGTSIGKRYARTDELGVPFAITVDSMSSVTVRERDSKQQIRVNVDEVVSAVKQLTDGVITWDEMSLRYPTHSSWPKMNWFLRYTILVELHHFNLSLFLFFYFFTKITPSPWVIIAELLWCVLESLLSIRKLLLVLSWSKSTYLETNNTSLEVRFC